MLVCRAAQQNRACAAGVSILTGTTNSRFSCMCGAKFGTCIGGLKANTSIKFGVNLINNEGVISDFTHKAKLNFCHAYRVNCFEEQAENWYVARLNVRGVRFGS